MPSAVRCAGLLGLCLRGTLDVDLSDFLSPERAVRVRLACFKTSAASCPLRKPPNCCGEHGFCSVKFAGMRLYFILAYHSLLRIGLCVWRKRLGVGGRPIVAWDAETLAVFKMMFFRRKDLADVELYSPHVRGCNSTGSGCGNNSLGCMAPAIPRLSAWDELGKATCQQFEEGMTWPGIAPCPSLRSWRVARPDWRAVWFMLESGWERKAWDGSTSRGFARRLGVGRQWRTALQHRPFAMSPEG